MKTLGEMNSFLLRVEFNVHSFKNGMKSQIVIVICIFKVGGLIDLMTMASLRFGFLVDNGLPSQLLHASHQYIISKYDVRVSANYTDFLITFHTEF